MVGFSSQSWVVFRGLELDPFPNLSHQRHKISKRPVTSHTNLTGAEGGRGPRWFCGQRVDQARWFCCWFLLVPVVVVVVSLSRTFGTSFLMLQSKLALFWVGSWNWNKGRKWTMNLLDCQRWHGPVHGTMTDFSWFFHVGSTTGPKTNINIWGGIS